MTFHESPTDIPGRERYDGSDREWGGGAGSRQEGETARDGV